MSNLLESYVRKTKVIEMGGKKLKFSQLSLIDFGRIKARLRKEMQEEADVKKEKLIANAKRLGDIDPMTLLEKLEVEPSDDDVFERMEEVKHLAFAAYLSLKYRYPDISEEEVGSLLSLDTIEEVVGILFISDQKKTKPPMKRKRGVIKKKKE